MNISIRHWLLEHHIEIQQIRGFSAGQMAGLAFRIVLDMEVKSLMPFDICTLAEVLEQPLAIVWQEITAIAQLTASLVNALSQKKPLKRNEGTWLTFQIAYLQALQQVIQQEATLKRLWLNRAMVSQVETSDQGENFFASPHPFPLPPTPQLQGLLKTLSPGKLTDTQAEQALSLVADSLLVQQMNNATVAWLVANGAEEPEAKLMTARMCYALAGHLLAVIAENAAPLAQLQKFVRLGNFVNNTRTSEAGWGVSDKIDLYREHYRANLIQSLSEPLLMESFALNDIYVPLQGSLVKEDNSFTTVDLIAWAQQQLTDIETIAVIESEAGYGKTSFCQIFAALVARDFYPNWMPVFIRLSDIKYGKTLVETLNSGVQGNFHTNFAASLNLHHPQCLLLLDGLDELPPCPQGNMASLIFIQQLLSFQSRSRHKIILTTRSIALQQILTELPLQLQRISIQPFEPELLKQWFQQWAKVQSLAIAQNFFTFLKESGLFASKSNTLELAKLTRQPLMLYVLGVLHRDGMLDDKILQLTANTQDFGSAPIYFEIFHRLNRWLLGYPLEGGIKTVMLRSDSNHIHRTPDAIANLLGSHHPSYLLQSMRAIALKILHSQHNQVNITQESNPKSLPAFYFRSKEFSPSPPNPTPQGHILQRRGSVLAIKFSHPKLGEYLCADAVINELKLLSYQQENVYGQLSFVLDSDSSVAQHLYNLLGYGILSEEIEALVIEGLRRQQPGEFSFKIFCDRLNNFWYAYCRGRWLDEGIAHKALTYFQTLQNPANVEQVNAAVGLNIFLLLCAASKEAKVQFLPCGNPTSLAEFNPEALITLIARTAALHKNAFFLRIRSKSLVELNLSRAYLSQVMLACANLEEINLSNAVLTGANLTDVNLQKANLIDANLTGANLTGANLTGANLTGANLTGANLTGANLTKVNLANACLFNTILDDNNKKMASSNGAMFSLEQFQSFKRLLLQQNHFNMPDSRENTSVWFSSSDGAGMIQSVEGEPMLATDLSEDYAEDETVFGTNLYE
jgi:Pentapeptide repeats (8 copies)/NACHT domain